MIEIECKDMNYKRICFLALPVLPRKGEVIVIKDRFYDINQICYIAEADRVLPVVVYLKEVFKNGSELNG